MRKALHYDQLAQLATQDTDPAFPAYGWDLFVYILDDYDTPEQAIDAALKIGFNLGLRAARGENLAELPITPRPSGITTGATT